MTNSNTRVQFAPTTTEVSITPRCQTMDTISTTTTTYLDLLHIATELILIICGIIVIVSCVLSLGIAVLGICRLQKGLDYYTKPYLEEWESSVNTI